jgi:2-polyprenyl-3-methyl-5-hydroxy-6-metoxy-1,4-benzoquinol methylase
MSEAFSLEEFYDAYPRIEEEFQRALDVSLRPRGSGMLYDLVSDLGLPPGASVLDVGCGEGKQALALAERFAVNVRGVDPGEWPPLGQAASAQAGSGPGVAGAAPTGCPRLAHCWASQPRQS